MRTKCFEFIEKIGLRTVNALLSLLALVLFLLVNFDKPNFSEEYSGLELIKLYFKYEYNSLFLYILYIIIPLIVFLLFVCVCKDSGKRARRIISSCLMLVPALATMFYLKEINPYVGFYVYVFISVVMIFMNFIKKNKHILVTSIALIVVVFGVVYIKSELRANILIRLNYNPRNTYRMLQTGRVILNKHEVSDHNYVEFCSGMMKWQDNSGYNIFLAGINAPRQFGCLSGCDGCEECFKLYQTEGLINYQVLNEDDNYIIAEVQLTNKGEKYALDKRISKNNPDYDEIMAKKDSGVRYVLYSYGKFDGFDKHSDGGLMISWDGLSKIVCHSDSYILTKYTPFATALGDDNEGLRLGRDYLKLYKTDDKGWMQELH